ncbi:MAG: DUF547 domain-containing protein [Saprospirales bacterium]|nr:DUF547 domain-containing protein [Saprospirales bacterium]MBK8493050.1 DUF547 domain-containing protein [Saprospirales bacterium]
MFKSFFLAALFVSTLSCAQVPAQGPPVSHAIWDGLLQKHVGADGLVNYKGFVQDSALLNKYLGLLSSTHPGGNWPRDEQMAFWINAYNAFTVKLIVDNYPVSSIKDIKNGIPFVNTVWDITFINLMGNQYDLNNIEHGILRKQFKDPRIHAALNCASWSCPALREEAYVASRLDSQLDDAMRRFVNDPIRNRVSVDKAELSQIFNWYGGDFREEAGSVQDFINRFAKVKLGVKGSISYLEYDWRLNTR